MASGADGSNIPVDSSGGGGTGGGAAPIIEGTTDTPGEATLLVSEFPPPPYYYYLAAGPSGRASSLKPPEIPKDALSRGTRRAAANAARARAEAERIRLLEAGANDPHIDKTDAILGGVSTATAGLADAADEEGDVVAVFGEIVEDPLLVVPLDVCEDPNIVRDEVKRLNRQVLQGFVQLVQDLVYNPMNNKKTRDELSHNIFLMLQECNKFREHQAREVLIELLEMQLHHRKTLIQELQVGISKADELLAGTSTTNEKLASSNTDDMEDDVRRD